MRTITTLFLLLFVNIVFAQKVQDLFTASDTKVTWLGIDFSNVKLIGDFEGKNPIEIKERFFPAWNRLILDEREKYDIRGMLRKEKLGYNLDMISSINAKAPAEELEVYDAVTYEKADIQKFVSKYKPEDKSGIGIVFVAEALNKSANEGWFHVVAINLSNNQILMHERMNGKPKGFGLRNYWAGAVYNIIKEIKETKYNQWKLEYQ